MIVVVVVVVGGEEGSLVGGLEGWWVGAVGCGGNSGCKLLPLRTLPSLFPSSSSNFASPKETKTANYDNIGTVCGSSA